MFVIVVEDPGRLSTTTLPALKCRIAAGVSNVDVSNPCTICVGWTSRTWSKLRRSLVDARLRAINRGRQHWTSAFPYLEAWITKLASTAAS